MSHVEVKLDQGVYEVTLYSQAGKLKIFLTKGEIIEMGARVIDGETDFIIGDSVFTTHN